MTLILHKRLPAQVEAVPEARLAVCSALAGAGLTDGTLQRAVALSVTEATANVIRHAYPRADDGRFEITVVHHPSTIEVAVHDDGVGIDSGRVIDPGAGFGLLLMRTQAQRLDIASGADGTTVTMHFELGE